MCIARLETWKMLSSKSRGARWGHQAQADAGWGGVHSPPAQCGPRGWQGQALSLPAPPEPGHGSLGVQTQAGCDAGTYNTGSVSSALRPALELLKPWALPK